MTPRSRRSGRWLLVAAAAGALMVAAACHDPDAPPAASPPPQVSGFVIEHMGRGGALRRVIYEPPPNLARPEPTEMELPFPGPEVDDAEIPDPVPEDDNDETDPANGEPGQDPGADPAPVPG